MKKLQMLFWCGVSALCFAVWPSLTSHAKVPPAWTCLIIGLVSLMPILIFFLVKGGQAITLVQAKAAIFAGLINGIGFVIYTILLSGKYEVSRVVTIIDVLVVVIAVIVGCLFLKEPMTTNKAIGLVLAVVSIYFLHQ